MDILPIILPNTMAHYQSQGGSEEGVNTDSGQLPDALQQGDTVQDSLYRQQQQQLLLLQQQQQQQSRELLPQQALDCFNGAFGQWPDNLFADRSAAFTLPTTRQDSSFEEQSDEPVPSVEEDETTADMAAISSAAPSNSQTATSMPVDAPGLLTQQWTVPPRPKPGRKPADDSPISKRKAQNRQAQRNFRERKAKKVDELEAEMQRMKQEFNFSRTALMQQHELDRTKRDEELLELQSKLEKINTQLHKKNEEAKQLQKQMADAQRQAADNQNLIQAMNHQRLDSTSSTATSNFRWGSIPSTAGTARTSISYTSPTSAQQPGFALKLPHPGVKRVESNVCGNCGLGIGACQCVEKTLSRLSEPIPPDEMIPQQLQLQQQQQQHMSSAEQIQIPLKPALPMQQPTPGDEMEIDFTAQYARPRLQTANSQNQLITPVVPAESGVSGDAGRPADHCGFCTNDTNCVCREAANASEDSGSGDQADDESSAGRAMSSRSQSLRPQPMEPRVSLTEPGNCPSCRADPAKANFCRSLAAMRMPAILQPGPTPSFPNFGGPINNYISCSEAFDKLRDDPMFATASETQREGLMRQLNQRQRVSEQGRTPMEVENASILLTLSTGNTPPNSRG